MIGNQYTPADLARIEQARKESARDLAATLARELQRLNETGIDYAELHNNLHAFEEWATTVAENLGATPDMLNPYTDDDE